MKLFTRDSFLSVYKKIFKDGHASCNAGDQWEPMTSPDHLADVANEFVDRYIAEFGVRVLGYHDNDYAPGKGWLFDNLQIENPGDAYTHEAIVVCIKQISKKKCEHISLQHKDLLGRYTAKCKLCGESLKPTGWTSE